ncbi:MAG: MmgE/PrpD family protein [Alphaproteobacteria bacterium]|nr:MmgE/PrpD family protein [Alphaproteobacteria bacterium]
MSLTRTLAEEIAGTRYADVPAAAMARIERLLIDHIGVAVMGQRLTGGAMAAAAKTAGGAADAVILGDGARVSAESAAAINAQVCRNTDFEETGPGLHAGPVIAHTAFALGQQVRASGADVLAAMTIGYELNARFFYARRDGDIRHLNVCAAAVAAKLLGQDAPALDRSLSLAWEFPSNTLFVAAKTPKRVSRMGLGNYWTCRNGIQAATLVQHGFDQIPGELDLLGDRYDLGGLTASPQPYAYTAGELMLKPWPASRLCHGVIQMVLGIMARENLTADDIEGIDCGLADIYLVPHQTDPAPDDYWQAIYSVEWNVAMAILGLPAGPAWTAPEVLADPAARALAARITAHELPEASAAFRARNWQVLPNTVTMRAGGQTFDDRIVYRDVLGSPGNPMPDAFFDDKFLRLAGMALDPTGARAALSACKTVATCLDVNDIAAHFAV